MDSIDSTISPPTDFAIVVIVNGYPTAFTVKFAVGVKIVAPFASPPFVDRYETTILLPATGAFPRLTPSPKDN